MTEQIEIVFNFDTTGSMRQVIGAVRKQVEQIVTELFKEVPNLKIGIGANGDYCDEVSTYITKSIDLTNSIHDITQFVRNVENTGGGDWPECYELVLNESKNYDWSLNARKIFVLIGDAIPHEPSYSLNKQKLDWRAEARKLSDLGVQIYSIQCLPHRSATPFWEEVAKIGNGYHLQLDQFADIVSMVQAIVYKQVSPEAFEKHEEKVAASGRMNRTLDASFGVLSGRPRDAKTGRFVAYKNVFDDGEKLVPVEPGRFQVLNVPVDSVIREFVEDNDLDFKPGRGFYEVTKSERISAKKEIVIRHKVTGDVFTGVVVRKLLGIPEDMDQNQKRKFQSSEYDIFVQSTSYNRKLVGGTQFLYEVTMEI